MSLIDQWSPFPWEITLCVVSIRLKWSSPGEHLDNQEGTQKAITVRYHRDP